MRCEGWRRYGGAFSFGQPRWEQCKNRASVRLTVEQNGESNTFPACHVCWDEAKEKGIHILKDEPILDTRDLSIDTIGDGLEALQNQEVNAITVHYAPGQWSERIARDFAEFAVDEFHFEITSDEPPVIKMERKVADGTGGAAFVQAGDR